MPSPGPRPMPSPGPRPMPSPNHPRHPGNRPLPQGGPIFRGPHGNVIHGRHNDRIIYGNNRMNTVMRRDPRVGVWVNNQSRVYYNQYRPYLMTRHNWYHGHYNTWRNHYRPWYRWGFYGGYYWNYRPVLDIHVHFWNPMIYWFYISTWDEHYYRVWYERHYDQYPELRSPFPYAGVFFPTEEFRDLSLSVSGMDIRAQINYRHAIVSLHDQLRAEMSRLLGMTVMFGQNDIVITHYQFLPSDYGAVVEGFANFQNQSLPFKAYLDLSTGSTQLFATVNDGNNPSPQEIEALNALNARIISAGGIVEGEGLQIH